MKRWLVAGLAVAALAGCRNQNEDLPEPRPGESGAVDEPGETDALITVGGVVTRAEGDELSLRTAQGNIVEMEIAEGAQIMLGGQTVERDLIEPGASVRAAFREENGERIARRVDIDRAAAGPTPTPSATPSIRGMEADAPGAEGAQQQGAQQQDGQQQGAGGR